jgi:hypothetical protein
LDFFLLELFDDVHMSAHRVKREEVKA